MPTSQNTVAQLTRRAFLRQSTFALAGGLTAASLPNLIFHPLKNETLPAQPNILLIITDQERYPQYWPTGWADANLLQRKRIRDHGITFTQAFCNSAMCTPSRSTLFTGLYPPQTGAIATLAYENNANALAQPYLQPWVQNMAHMLNLQGYYVAYKGKWHLSKHSDGLAPDANDVLRYGFHDWDAPDAGDDTAMTGFGGGCAANDLRYKNDAVNFLNTTAVDLHQSPGGRRPFALIVSLVNPHDLLSYPRTWDDDSGQSCSYTNVSVGIDIQLSAISTRNENLATNNKPTCQSECLTMLAAGLGTLNNDAERLKYINFYAYLQKQVDVYIGEILDALQGGTIPGTDHIDLTAQTVIVRTSDHGEMGLSHGGLRQKMFNAYEETIHVPLEFSNPILFPTPQTTNSLASLVDVMPTLHALAHVESNAFHFSGNSLLPIFSNPAAKVQDEILFVFDDEDAGAPGAPEVVHQPNHIRCIRSENFKYVRYFDPGGTAAPQYEFYALGSGGDPTEYTNYINQPTYTSEQAAMAARLAVLESEKLLPMNNIFLPTLKK
ncbi:MAG TPA: sulfatase-like hydrolase/transferase [Anaerolineaceae bacterium]